MTDQPTRSALQLLLAADAFRAGLSGEFSAIHGLSVNEFLMMLHLDRTEARRLSRVELARRMHVSASTITRMAAPMEKIGLLSREADPRDARLAFVVLTATGQEKLADALATFAKRAGYVFGTGWKEEEVAAFADMLGRVAPGAMPLEG
ncbi:MarR family winged helix-turn-helix transcriptional regulator [Roseobacter sp. HKCCA0434]|uniref:MarR family winged helix-turn-helix transcriptional regulator n=1 Tax=Roseobacter sp. HKCCA0434 TaxID=3079297 RepID=UPI002905DBD9|nr:MarR family transcriptional regulator [Roseobacter sp. HKCCA0434]